MKKILSAILFSSFVALSVSSVNAGESKAGGLELSGNIDVVTGWQHDGKNSAGDFAGGQLGWFRGFTAPGRDTFDFYVDQVELDINKSFGENIRIRADLDFGRQLSGSGRNTNTANPFAIPAPANNFSTNSNFELEQGYVTFNLKGAEVLIGRFNAPIGYYVVDRADNPTISFSENYNYLTPTNITGGKIYYAFSDLIDWHVYVVNNLADSIPFGSNLPAPTANGNLGNPGGLTNGAYSAIPSWGERLGFNWGADDTKSTLGISYAGGPERFGCNFNPAALTATGCNRHLTTIVDLDWAVKFTPALLFAGEGTFRQDNAISGPNDRAYAAFGLLNYDINSNWRVYGRFGWMQDRNGFYTGALNPVTGAPMGQNIYDGAVGFGYQIAEGAKMKVEYSPTVFVPRKAPGVGTAWSNGFALEFAYNF